MKILITCGPTITRLDQVRHIGNNSSGHLGSYLAEAARDAGHDVVCLRSAYCTRPAPQGAVCEGFSTHQELMTLLHSHASGDIGAVWHAAAVGDFVFDSACDEKGRSLTQGKWSSRSGKITLTLVPAPKIICELRTLFPRSFLCGWKYEVEGDQSSAVQVAKAQLESNRTDACVINGPAWGHGYAILSSGQLLRCSDETALFRNLLKITTQYHFEPA